MIDVLLKIERTIIKDFIKNAVLNSDDLNTLHIDYHEPFVDRIWFVYEKYRVYLHKIYPAQSSDAALFHPHPWKSAVRIVSPVGYEMGIGHSSTNDIPKIDCKININQGVYYEMTEADGWHYVNPKRFPSYSLMVSGDLYNREMPIEPLKEFRKLNKEEILDILRNFEDYYLRY